MEYETFLIDFRGCGGSSGEVTTIGFLEAEDVEASVRFVRKHVTQKPLILYGQSMGSVAVLRAVSQRELGAQALILECPFDRLISTAKNRFAMMGIPSFPFEQLLSFRGGFQHGFSGFQHNPVDYALEVDCPVLLMNGELDDRVTKEQVTSVFDHIQVRKRLVFFPGTGHEPCLPGNAELWQHTIEDFLGTF